MIYFRISHRLSQHKASNPSTPSASFFHQDLSDIKHQINKRKKKKNYTQQQIEKLGRNEPGCKHISLTQKDLTEKDLFKAFQFLESHQFIEKIYFGETITFSHKLTLALAKAFEKNQSLKWIYGLEQSRIDQNDFLLLIKSLEKHPTLSHISLQPQMNPLSLFESTQCSLKMKALTSFQAKDVLLPIDLESTFSTLFRNQNQLTVLSFPGLKLSSQGFVTLFQNLKTVRTLHNLNLSDSPHIGQYGSVPLLDFLNCGLKMVRIVLQNCNITDQIATEIAAFLLSDTHLRDLFLQKNQISDIGAESLYHSLKTNQTLLTICLYENPVSFDSDTLTDQIRYNNRSRTRAVKSIKKCDPYTLYHCLEKGISPNTFDPKSLEKAKMKNSPIHPTTLLHLAAASGHLSLVDQILWFKPSLTMVNKNGQTPLEVAYHKGHQDVFILLRYEKDKPEIRRLLLLCRTFQPHSTLHKDHFPLDLFKILFFFSRLIR